MRGNLEARITKLEEASTPGAELTVVLRSFADGPIVGYSIGGQATERIPGEDEDTLLHRALASAPHRGSLLVVHELRG